MTEYSDIIDKALIFTSCLILYLFKADIYVVPILVAIIASSLLSYFSRDMLKIGLITVYAVSCVLFPSLTYFLPLICYDLFFSNFQYIGLFTIPSLFELYKSASVEIFAFFLIGLAFSVFFKYKTQTYIRLREKYYSMNDTKNELSMELKKKNYDLMEKQDYEINLATLNERNRIAREIHDSVGHLLSSSILQVGALIAVNRDEKIREGLKNLNNTLTQAMNSIRSSVHNLYDESIDLNAQVEEILKDFTFCPVSYDYGLTTNPDKKLKYAFIFIIKEALSNIIKHSNATSVSVTFREHPAIYQLIITDNGKAASYKIDEGLGLRNMVDRIESFNGNINFNTDKGFEIFISVPKGDL